MNTPTSRRYLVVAWDAAADAPTDVEWMRHPFDKYWLFKPTEDGTFERHYQMIALTEIPQVCSSNFLTCEVGSS
jgi:hypothetical protein